MEYYSAIRMKSLPFVTTQEDLEGSMAREIKMEKDNYRMLSYLESKKTNKQNKTKTHRYRQQTGIYRRGGSGGVKW